MASELVLPGRYGTGVTMDYLVEEQRLRLDRTAFMLVDVYGLGYSDGEPDPERPTLLTKRMFERERDMIRNAIRPALEAAREIGLPIVYVTNWSPGIGDNNSEFGKLARRVYGLEVEEEFAPDSPALKFSRIIAPQPGEYLVKKQMYDGFFESCLDSLLRNLGVKNLICVGFGANICLLCTMIGGFFRNYRMILIRDCTLALEFPDTEDGLLLTKEAIRYIERWVGFSVSLTEFQEACTRCRAEVSSVLLTG